MLRNLILGVAVAVMAGRAPQPLRLVIRPLVVPESDTTDHVDLAWQSQPDHAAAVVVAVVYDSAGRLLLNQRVRWTVSDPSVVTVRDSTANGTANGILTARGFGATTITATVQGVTSTLVACVYGAAYTGGVVVTGPAKVPLGQQMQYVATETNGATIPPPCVHWSTSDPAARITRRGAVTGTGLNPNVNVRAFVGVP